MADKTEFQKLLESHGFRMSGLADRLGVNKATVTRWGQRQIPAERVLEVERETGINREILRPDLYPPAPTSEVA